MTDPNGKNGRIVIGLKEVLGVVMFLGSVGGTWATLNYRVSAQDRSIESHNEQLDNLDDRQDSTDTDIALVKQDVGQIKEDVAEIRQGQAAQQALLNTILTEVQKGP